MTVDEKEESCRSMRTGGELVSETGTRELAMASSHGSRDVRVIRTYLYQYHMVPCTIICIDSIYMDWTVD